MTRILLTGANGQVGWELARSLMPLGEVVALNRQQCDLSQPQTLAGVIDALKPQIIVNAAAYTTVDKAEDEEALATRINGTAVGVLAEQARKHRALLVHYSTDYVFDGSKPTPYSEADQPNPLNAYGRSKLAGEQAIAQIGGDALILRTTWVYAARGQNFLRTISRLAQQRLQTEKPEALRIVNDQTGAPTWARNLADVTAHLIVAAQGRRQSSNEASTNEFSVSPLNPSPQRLEVELLHLSAQGTATWYDFAQTFLRAQQINLPLLPISSADYPSKTQRPKNSLLSTERLQQHWGLPCRPGSKAWRHV